MTVIRYFAGAAHAAGRAQATVDATGLSVAEAAQAGTDADVSRILAVASFLLDGALTDANAPVGQAKQLDVLPPFAGG